MSDLISRQAAIDAVRDRMGKGETHIGDTFIECFEMMLNALPSAQPEPLTEEEKRLLKKLRSYHNGSYAKILDKLVASAQPEQQWIPCSERLPEELEEVNVTWVNHKPEPYYDFVKDKPFTASAVYYKDDWYWYSSVCADLLAERGENEIDKIDDAIEITAWMPLPEPYQAGRREE